MIMKSRDEQGPLKSLRRFVWPKKSYLRSLRYYGKRILRIRATPHALALGFAAGIFAAFSPALGLHIVIAVALAWGLGGNFIAAALGTAAANPLTFPVMIAGEFKLGQSLFGGVGDLPVPFHTIGAKLSHFDFAGTWHPLFKPLLAGSMLLGTIFAALSYLMVLYAARSFEARRHERKLKRELPVL